MGQEMKENVSKIENLSYSFLILYKTKIKNSF